MANIVQIILSGKDLTGPAFASAHKSILGMSKGMADFAKIGIAAASTAAAGIVLMTQRAINAADEMNTMAQRAGLATDEFSKLSYSAGLADVSQENLVTAMKKVSQEMVAQGRAGQSLSGEVFRIVQEFEGLSSGAAKVNFAVERFGKTGQTLIPWLNEGSVAIRRQTEEAVRFGKVISVDFGRNADQFNDNLSRMRSLIDGVFLRFAEKILPALNQQMEKFIGFLKETNADVKFVNALATAFGYVADNIDRAAIGYGVFKNAFKGGSSGVDAFIAEQAGKALGQSVAGSIFAGTVTKSTKDKPQDIPEPAQSWEVLYEDQKNLLLAALEERSYAARLRAHRAFEAAKVARTRDTFAATAQLMGSFAALAQTFGKKGFVAYQALSIGEAIISTALGVTKALGSTSPPLNFILAAAVAAAGAAQIATILAQKPPQAHGGLDFVDRESTYLLSRGERVLQPEANRDLTEFLDSGGGRGGSIYLDGQLVGEVLYEMSRDGRFSIHERGVRAA